MTPQELFTRAYNGTVKQGVPAESLDGCYYWSDDNCLMCGVGHAVGRDIAKRLQVDGGGVAVSDLRISVVDELPEWVTGNADLLDDIQAAHDGSDLSPKGMAWLDYFKASMATVAKKHGLVLEDAQ